MGIQKEHHQNLAQITHEYSLDFFNSHLSSIIKESLITQNLWQCRCGTVLAPTFVIWFVILSTIRRDLSYPSVVNWMISGIRWLSCKLPKKLRS